MREFFLGFFCFICHLIPISSEAEPSILSIQGENASSPAIVVNPFGDTIAVWNRFDGSHLIIQSSTKIKGQNWQVNPDNLSSPGKDGDHPKIAVDSKGNITVIWQSLEGSESYILATTKRRGENWKGLPVRLSLPGQYASAPQLVVDSSGLVTAVWQSFDGNKEFIQSSSKPLGGNWTIPDTISASNLNASHPHIAVDSFGNLTVVWQSFDGQECLIQSSSKLLRQTWGGISTLSLLGQHADSPQIGVDPFGNVIAVWHCFYDNHGDIQASSKPKDGTWQKIPDRLTNVSFNAFNPKVKMDPFGNALAVWELSEKGGCLIQAAEKPSGQNWQAPVNLSQPEYNTLNSQIAIDSHGNAIVIWHTNKHFTSIQASFKPRDHTWQNLGNISTRLDRSAYEPQVLINPFGQATIIWTQFDGLSHIESVDKILN